MKKLYIFPFMLGAIALSSCSMFPVSVSDANQVLKNIVNKATTNGKYIGGKFLSRHSALSNITYDLDTAIVEEHRTDKYYYFDLENKYFRLDQIKTDRITEYSGIEQTKTIENDHYLYVLNGYVYNTIVTTINGVASDKVVTREPVTVNSMKVFSNVVDEHYNSFTRLFEEALAYTEVVLSKDDDYLETIDTTLESYSKTNLSYLSTGLIPDVNLAVSYKFSLLSEFQTFNRDTHVLHTEEISYDNVPLNYVK
jgi:hypothetical protein